MSHFEVMRCDFEIALRLLCCMNEIMVCGDDEKRMIKKMICGLEMEDVVRFWNWVMRMYRFGWLSLLVYLRLQC